MTQLLEFLEGLPRDRFATGPREQILVRELLLELLEQGPLDLRRMPNLLGPIVCSSPGSQAEFHALWADAFGEQEKGRKTPEAAGNVWWSLAAALAVLVVGLTAWARYPALPALPDPPKPPGQPVLEASPSFVPRAIEGFEGQVRDALGRPVSGAMVYLPSAMGSAKWPATTTDAQGRFAVDAGKQEWPLLVVHPGHAPAYVTAQPANGAVAIPLVDEDPMVLRETRVTRRAWPWWVSALAALLPLAAVAWWARRILAQQAELQKWETPLSLTPLRVATRSGEAGLFQSAWVVEWARDLARRTPKGSLRLAIAETVDATAKRGGLVTAIWTEETQKREHLVLVERMNSRDQQARLCGALLDRLKERDVYLDRYFFAADPQVCEVPGKERAWVKLDELGALHPRHDLWIVTRAGALFHPLTGEAQPWLLAAARWETRTLVLTSPISPGARRQLEVLGYQVKPLPEAAGYPALLEGEERRWLAREMPPDEDLAALDGQLREYLGDAGYRLLQACAVYPGLAWNLTLHLGDVSRAGGAKAPRGLKSALRGVDGESVLAKVTGLPWFRYSRMPEWLRTRLAEGIGAAQRESVLAALNEFLKSAGKVTRRETGGVEFVRKQIAEGTEGPLRDEVFLNFVTGRTGVSAPGTLEKLLYPDGRPERGVRWPVVVAGAVLLSLAAAGISEWGARTTEVRPDRVNRAALGPETAFPELAPAWRLALALARAQIGQPAEIPFGEWLAHTAGDFGTIRLGKATPVAGVSPGMFTRDANGRQGIVEAVYPRGFVRIEPSANGMVERRYSELDQWRGQFLRHEAIANTNSPEVRLNTRDGLNYRYIKPGKFLMGCSPGDKDCEDDEKPAHEVEITKGFWLGETEVTVAAYRRFAQATGRAMPAEPEFGRPLNPGWRDGQMPIVNVDWNDARNYCSWSGGRLPTEAEWEYAARAGATGALYGPLNEVAWTADNSGRQPLQSRALWAKEQDKYLDRLMANANGFHRVGQKRPNAWGLHDMLGNVWEWNADWYDKGYYKSSLRQDPAGPGSGKERVLRGGAWGNIPEGVRLSLRCRNVTTVRSNFAGFRCAGEFR